MKASTLLHSSMCLTEEVCLSRTLCRAGVFDRDQTLANEVELGGKQQHLGTADLLPGTEGSSVPYRTQIYSR